MIKKLLLCATLAVLAGCDDSDPPTQLLSSQPYTMAKNLDEVSANTLLLRYRMPAVLGGETEANALLFVPHGNPPAGGWPLVVKAHGTRGAPTAVHPAVITTTTRRRTTPLSC